MEDDYDKVGQEVFHPTAPSGDKIIQLLGCVHLSEVALLFGIDDINKAEADVMKGSSRRYYTSSNGTKCEVFEFDRYMGAEQKPKKLLKEVKPVKKIPFYHHRRRF